MRYLRYLGLSFLLRCSTESPSHRAYKAKKQYSCFWKSTGWNYFYRSLTRLHSRICIRIYVFNFKNNRNKNSGNNTKVKETKEEKRISVESLTGYDDTMMSFANLFCVLLTYLFELWICPGCSYEFNVDNF